jgi:hypothetical protein
MGLAVTPEQRRLTMNWKNYVRLIIPTIGIAMSSVVSQGCANSKGAPFHMYDSPLLEGRVDSRYPRSRTYDPLELGDHNKPTTRYAENEGRGGKAVRTSTEGSSSPQPTQQTNTPAKKPPSLSTTRKGAPQATEASARPAHRGDGESGLAADYVWSVYGLNGVDFSSGARRSISTLFRECKERGKIYHASRPAIGDVVFFHNTDDLNDDGRNNDWYTHAAIVEGLGDDGRATLLGYRGDEVQRFVMNLESPDASKTRHGEVANAQLRAKRGEDPPFTQYLAGQLFAGTCSVLGERAELVVIDNWKPGMKLER